MDTIYQMENNLPKITVVTVVLNLIANNRIDMFRKCVQSIKEQTYSNIEHLVIDGASTDGTVDILRDMNLHFLSEKDAGIYDAMNKGTLRATGKYIIFMNSDDYFTSPRSIEHVIHVFQKTNADAVYGQSIIIDDSKKTKKHKKYQVETFYYHMPICHQSFIYTVSSLKEIGLLDKTYKIAADYNSVYKLILSGKLIVPVHHVISNFTLGGISTTNQQKSKEESIRVIFENLSHLREDIDMKKARQIAESHFLPFSLYWQIRTCIHAQLRKSFDYIYFKSFFHILRRYLFIFHFKKNKRYIRFLGITIYNRK